MKYIPFANAEISTLVLLLLAAMLFNVCPSIFNISMLTFCGVSIIKLSVEGFGKMLIEDSGNWFSSIETPPLVVFKIVHYYLQYIQYWYR